MSRNGNARNVRAFTLMEILISMVLMVILISIVAGSVDFHLRQLTVRKTNIEESQVARVVLRRIADDLRAVAISRPIGRSSDSGGLTGSSASSTDANSAEMSEDGSGDTSASGMEMGSSDSSSSSTDLTGLESINSASNAQAGFYGSLYELQVDVSRIPRYEEYSMMGDPATMSRVGLASDVTTVSYFVSDGSSGLSTGLGSNMSADDWSASGAQLEQNTETPQGLARRVVERAAERYARETGDFNQIQEQVDVFAPEVLWIEFRYFDGQQWLTDWDSDVMGGVPMAVEITMELGAVQEGQSQASPNATLNGEFNEHIYRLVVHLPAAEPLTESTMGATGSTTTTSSSATGGGL